MSVGELHHVTVGVHGGISAHRMDGWRVTTYTNANADHYGYLTAARAQGAAIVSWWPPMGADDSRVLRCSIHGPLAATPGEEPDAPGPDGWTWFQRAPFAAWLAIQEAFGARVEPGRFAAAMADAHTHPAVQATLARLRKHTGSVPVHA